MTTTNEPEKEEAPPALPDIAAAEEEKTTTATEKKGAAKAVPNAKPRPAQSNPDDTYVYKDYATVSLESLDTDTCHKKVPPACLQAQKLPSKMAVMLVDPGEQLNCFLVLTTNVILDTFTFIARLQCTT